MPAFLYRCPVTNQNVQGWVSEEIGDDALRPVMCLACRRPHLIDPKTGRSPGDTERLPG